MMAKTRVVNVTKEKADVYIGRPSNWGNPFFLRAGASLKERRAVIDQYRKYINSNARLRDRIVPELKGKTLGCFCAPNPCHGDVLVEIAEGGEDRKP